MEPRLRDGCHTRRVRDEPEVVTRTRPIWAWVIGGAVVMIATIATIATIAAIGIVNSRGASQDAVCRGFGSRVAGLEAINWDNGITRSSSGWFNALTDGLEHADPASRRAIAAAVATDTSGYGSMVAELRPDERASFDRLHAAVMKPDDPKRALDDPETLRALSTVRRIGMARCNIF